MNQEAIIKWGKWVQARFRYLGFLRGADVAEAVGCNYEHFCRLCQLDEAPNRMLKGLDAKLVKVLKTDRFILFTGYRDVSPSDAPIVSEALSPVPV